jgi:RHH-type transcriptional regulator, rel operon repressor / antitoxin RelB
MLAIRLPAEIEDRLEALAKATGRTKTVPLEKVMKRHGMEG